MNLQGLYFITDRNLSKNGVIADVEAAIRGGCNVIQYREKDREYENIETEIERIRKITKEAGILFIVNDYVDLAQKYDADGVHVGQEDTEYQEARRILGPDKIIGVSTQTVEQAVEAEKQGADYIGVGAVFPTTTKDDAIETGLIILRQSVEQTNIPVVAIGGINKTNISQVIETRAQYYAIISSIYNGNIEDNCKYFNGLIK